MCVGGGGFGCRMASLLPAAPHCSFLISGQAWGGAGAGCRAANSWLQPVHLDITAPVGTLLVVPVTPADPRLSRRVPCHADVFIANRSRRPLLAASGGDNKSNYLPSMAPGQTGPV